MTGQPAKPLADQTVEELCDTAFALVEAGKLADAIKVQGFAIVKADALTQAALATKAVTS
jgi:hypothetical protein